MDWANERYVRLYTRDTEDDLLLSWEATALWRALLRKVDRAGVLEAKRGARSLALVSRIPLEVVERVLPELLADGRLAEHELGYVAPNFIEAQETPQSDRQRKVESRARRRDRGRHVPSHEVTDGHAQSHEVTNRDSEVTERDPNVTRGHTASRPVTSGHSDPLPDPDQTSKIERESVRGAVPPGIDLHRDWTLGLRVRRMAVVNELRADGIGSNLPPPSLVVDARVEVQALHLVQRWAAIAKEQGAEPGAVIEQRGDHLLAVLAAQARARADLSCLREETCWSPAVVGWAETTTPDAAAAAPDRRQRAGRDGPSKPRGPATPRNDHPTATELRDFE
jgi:hypothetical protein